MPHLWDRLTKQEQELRMNLQVLAEEEMLALSERRYWEEYDRQPDEGYPEQSLLDACVIHLTPSYQQWIDNVASSKKTPEWAYPLFAVGAAKMADITVRALIVEWFNSSFWDKKHDNDTFPLPTAQHISHVIAEMVIDIVAYQQIKKKFREDWLKQSHYQKNWTVKRCKAFTLKMQGLTKRSFSRKQRENFGHHMLRIAESSDIIRIQNHRSYTGRRWMERVLVSFTDDVLQELNKRHIDMIAKAALLYRPMIVPPTPHSLNNSGGHLLPFVRKPVVQKFKDVLWDEQVIQKGSTPSEMVVDGINAMMFTEWAVNTKVLEVMENLFKNNTRQANLPAYDFSAFDFGEPYPEDGTKEAQAKWCQRKEEAYTLWFKEERARGRMLVRLRLAKDLSKHQFFYHVYTCDFRGRANSACDLLSPQSSDFDRGLIQFATPAKQTPQGLYWLKVHIANLFDMDKVTFDERVKWTDDNMDKIKRTAEDPYEMRWFWVSDKKKKNPSFQRLASIFDICRLDGLTQIPVQMDGSCNGVQHWAAIMKDTDLAKKVNLVKADLPQDLYQYVADVITTMMHEDKDKDSNSGKWATRFLEYWQGKINRSVCKRAVMTDPYGVTLYGIRRYCKSEGHLDWVGKDQIAGAVMELATYIDKALKGTLVEPNKGKIWLKKIADMSSEVGHNLEWTTPCGFHVVHQYYEILSRRSVAKLFNMKELYFGVPDKNTIDPKQVNLAISPNYIHSLDASHMWCTVRRMMLAGVESYSMVHDSYGCHAPYVPMMRQFTTEEFEKMHELPLLQMLKEEVEKKLNIELPDPPETGAYDIKSVLDSQYLFQ
jgi:DNA-directed RNA polymerase